MYTHIEVQVYTRFHDEICVYEYICIYIISFTYLLDIYLNLL